MLLPMTNEIFPPGSGIRLRIITNATIHEGKRKDFGESYQVTVPAKITGGKRLRRQFDTREEAEIFANEQHKGTRALGQVFLQLDPADRQEAVAVLDLLRPKKLSL